MSVLEFQTSGRVIVVSSESCGVRVRRVEDWVGVQNGLIGFNNRLFPGIKLSRADLQVRIVVLKAATFLL